MKNQMRLLPMSKAVELMAAQGKKAGWTTSEKFVIANPKLRRVRHIVWLQDQPDGSTKVLYDQIILEEQGGAISVLTDEDGRLGFVKVFRPINNDQQKWARDFLNDENNIEELGRESIEFPRGFPKGSESVLETGAREAEEEGDRAIKSVKLIGWLNENTTFTPHNTAVVLGKVSNQASTLQTDPNEGLIKKLFWLTREEVSEKILKGEIICGLTLAALAHFDAHMAKHK